MTTLDLTPYRINHFSQFGEDGIVEKLMQLAGITDGWLVEFGAWDGIHLSNTRWHWLNNKKFGLMLIEENKARFEQLVKNYYTPNCGIVLINQTIELYGDNSLNRLFSYFDDRDLSLEYHEYESCILDGFALLSIDVDGGDLEIWLSLDKTKYRPKIVIIESGAWKDLKALDYLNKCFTDYGYNLVCVTGNYIFVRSDLGISSNMSIHELLDTSGCLDYDIYKGRITQEQYDDIAFRMYHIDENPDIYTTLAKPQIININD